MATTELRLLLTEMKFLLKKAWPVGLKLYVDDLTITGSGNGFDAVVTGAGPDHEEGALLLMKELVGEQIWERFFKGIDVVTSQFVPFQLGNIMNTALAKAEAILKKYCKEWDLSAKAKAHFDTLLQEDFDAKRARTGLYESKPGPY